MGASALRGAFTRNTTVTAISSPEWAISSRAVTAREKQDALSRNGRRSRQQFEVAPDIAGESIRRCQPEETEPVPFAARFLTTSRRTARHTASSF